jgi:hypothetical protein
METQQISNVYMTVDDQLVSLTPTSPVKRTMAESPKGQRNKNPRNNPSTTQITDEIRNTHTLTQQNFINAMNEKHAQKVEKQNWTIRDDDKLIQSSKTTIHE